MKKFLLLSLALTFGFAAMAQKVGKIPANLKNVPAIRVHKAVDIPLNMNNNYNPYVEATHAKAVNETQIGNTQYDLQTNGSVQNRIYLHPDGTIGATFTVSVSPSTYPDRGTAYNYFDGTAWGAITSTRIESARCGWPSYSPLLNGELAITHNGSTGLLVTSRATKGTGAWASTTLVGPVPTNTATTALLWPRSITVGNTIHLIACTDQNNSTTATMSQLWYYQGLSLALVYYKSTDGGATWSAPVVLPGMDSTSIKPSVNNLGYGGDGYAWAAPKGDTIAFSCGDSWSDFFVMKSFDAGATWTKVPIYQFPDAGLTAPTPIIASIDGSSACAIDENGLVHVVVGRMRVSDDDFADDPPASSYYPYTDGLIYWNESMPVLDSGSLNNETQLIASGNYIAGMLDYSGNDTIDFPSVASGSFPFGNYNISLSSMPQIIIDNAGDIYVTYSSCREDLTNPGATPNEQLYRHLYAMKSTDGGATWTTPNDLTGASLHNFDECVFGSLSYTSDANLHIIYQADQEPGLAVRGDEDASGDNSIYYITIPKAEIGSDIGFQEIQTIDGVSIYPNPASSVANIDMTPWFITKCKHSCL